MYLCISQYIGRHGPKGLLSILQFCRKLQMERGHGKHLHFLRNHTILDARMRRSPRY
jgi:hypothetical protein